MNRSPHRWLTATALFAVFLLGLAWRMYGLSRPIAMHPDERTILEWMERMRTHGRLQTSYAGGYFVLAEIARVAVEKLWYLPKERLRFLRGEIERPPQYLNVAEFVRGFNAWLGALTVLLIYALGRALGVEWLSAWWGALLFTGAAYPIEHSHYIETDTAAVATLTLALLSWARYGAKPIRARFALAALASGFAAGTKYPLLVLVPLAFWPALRSLRRPETPWSARISSALGALGLALVCMLIGFLVANPALAHTPKSYLAHAQIYGRRVLEETSGILGEAHTQPLTRQIGHARCLWHFLGSVGVGWLGLATLGLRAAARRRFRASSAAAVIFIAAFLWYWFAGAPFVRSQEFMLLLPAFAALAMLGADQLLHWAQSPRMRFATALGLLALSLPTLRLGAVASDRCGWSDTRWMARAWLQRTLPENSTVWHALYAMVNPIGKPVRIIGVDPLSPDARPALLPSPDYYLHNLSHVGRGHLNPRTGRPYPSYQEWLDRLHASSTVLRVWSPLEPDQPAVTFRSPALELRSLRGPASGPDFAIPLPRPALISDAPHETFAVIGESLGAASVLSVTRYERVIAVGGPLPEHGTIFVLLNTEEREAFIHVAGFGRRRTVSLAAYDAVVIPLRRAWWRPRFAAYERIRLRARPEPHIVQIPCWARLTGDPLIAADFLLTHGRSQEAWRLLQAYQAEDRNPELARRCAAAAGDAGAVEKWTEAGKSWCDALERELLRSDNPARVNTLPFDELRRLARLRWEPQSDGPLAQIRLQSQQKVGGLYTSDFSVPLRSAGPCRLTLAFCAQLTDSLEDEKTSGKSHHLELMDSTGRVLHRWPWSALTPQDENRVELNLAASPREHSVELRWRSPKRGVIKIRSMEVVWDPKALLASWLQQSESRSARALPALPSGQQALVFEPFLIVSRVERQKNGWRIRLDSLVVDPPPLQAAVIRHRWGRARIVRRFPLQAVRDAEALAWYVEVPAQWTRDPYQFAIVADVAFNPGALRIGPRRSIRFATLLQSACSPAVNELSLRAIHLSIQDRGSMKYEGLGKPSSGLEKSPAAARLVHPARARGPAFLSCVVQPPAVIERPLEILFCPVTSRGAPRLLQPRIR